MRRESEDKKLEGGMIREETESVQDVQGVR